MEYQNLGQTNLKVSKIGIGTWQLSGPYKLNGLPDGHDHISKKYVSKLIRFCSDRGINVIDCAPIYGNGRGEKMIGSIIKHSRDNWILSTKFDRYNKIKKNNSSNIDPKCIVDSLHHSLKNLKTDYLDIFMFHSLPNEINLMECVETLANLKNDGKIRYVGISTESINDIKLLNDFYKVDVIMFPHSIIDNPKDILRFVKDNKVGTMIRGVLKEGRLSGKYFYAKPSFTNNDIRINLNKNINFKNYSIFKSIVPDGMSMSQTAIKYIIDQPTTDTVILGAKNIQDYDIAIKSLGFPKLNFSKELLIKYLKLKLRLKNSTRFKSIKL